MPRIEPFAGLRYDADRVDLTAVIAPPYDVIDADERGRLAGRSPANAVRVELPDEDRARGLDRYRHAAELLAGWQHDGTLVQDPSPCFYAYRMTSPDGRATNGVIGALAVDDAGKGDILPHEQTLPKPKSDRLDLLRATRANLSPIWGLSLTPGLTATFLTETEPAASATDDDGVLHELWVLGDDHTVSAVREAVAASPIVIADGHHRYETALAYQRETGDSCADLIMAMVVELSEEQLAVGPVHRALSGLPDGLDLVDICSSWFDATRIADFEEETVRSLASSSSLALVMPSGIWRLEPKDGTPEAAGASLDSSMVALVIAELPDHELDFCHTWREVADAIETERAQAVLMLRPVTVDQIAEWAHAGRRMPPKTTYFHPKPRTGMVFRTLDA